MNRSELENTAASRLSLRLSCSTERQQIIPFFLTLVMALYASLFLRLWVLCVRWSIRLSSLMTYQVSHLPKTFKLDFIGCMKRLGKEHTSSPLSLVGSFLNMLQIAVHLWMLNL